MDGNRIYFYDSETQQAVLSATAYGVPDIGEEVSVQGSSEKVYRVDKRMMTVNIPTQNVQWKVWCTLVSQEPKAEPQPEQEKAPAAPKTTGKKTRKK